MITAASGLYINPPKTIRHLTLQAPDIESYQISKHFDECYRFIEDNLRNGIIVLSKLFKKRVNISSLCSGSIPKCINCNFLSYEEILLEL